MNSISLMLSTVFDTEYQISNVKYPYNFNYLDICSISFYTFKKRDVHMCKVNTRFYMSSDDFNNFSQFYEINHFGFYKHLL